MNDATSPGLDLGSAGPGYRVLARKYRPGGLSRPDRPGRDGAHHLECVRERAHPAGLDPDRRARRRENHDRPHPRPRAQLRTAGRLGDRTDHPHADARPALPVHHGKPARRRDRDGRGLAQRRRRRAPDQRGGALFAGLGALQGLHPRRSAHALDGRVQRAAQDAGGAAAACEVRVRDDRNPQGADHHPVALPALRPAPRRCFAAGAASRRHLRQGEAFRPSRKRSA